MTFEIHRGPLIPGSLRELRCCFEIGDGLGLSNRERINVTMSSVFKSHLLAFGVSPTVWKRAVERRRGNLGRMAFALGECQSISSDECEAIRTEDLQREWIGVHGLVAEELESCCQCG